MLSHGIYYFSQRCADWTNRIREWLKGTISTVKFIEIYGSAFAFVDHALITIIYTFKRLYSIVNAYPKWAKKRIKKQCSDNHRLSFWAAERHLDELLLLSSHVFFLIHFYFLNRRRKHNCRIVSNTRCGVENTL